MPYFGRPLKNKLEGIGSSYCDWDISNGLLESEEHKEPMTFEKIMRTLFWEGNLRARKLLRKFGTPVMDYTWEEGDPLVRL